jgi:hypothetical protein
MIILNLFAAIICFMGVAYDVLYGTVGNFTLLNAVLSVANAFCVGLYWKKTC